MATQNLLQILGVGGIRTPTKKFKCLPTHHQANLSLDIKKRYLLNINTYKRKNEKFIYVLKRIILINN